MPRTRRLDAPFATHHLISRFINREYRLHGEEERAEYLRRVPAVLASTDALPRAYAFMSSHVHWCVEMGEEPPARFIHPLHVGFAGWVNKFHGRTGPVFMERYSTVLCDEERIAILIAYQHNNPVRARLVADPADCGWTSHRAYLGLVIAPPWLDVEAGLAASGFNASPSGRAAFHDFVLSRAADPRESWLGGDDLREAGRHVRLAMGAPVGVSDARLSPRESRPRREVILRPGGVLRPRWPGEAMYVLLRVCAATGVHPDHARSRERASAVVSCRRVALWTWARGLGRQQAEMNAVIGLSSGGGSKLLASADTAERALAASIARQSWEELGGAELRIG